MGISTREISEVIKERLKDFDASLVATDVGLVQIDLNILGVPDFFVIPIV